MKKLDVITELNTEIANGITEDEEYEKEMECGMNIELDIAVKIETLAFLKKNRLALLAKVSCKPLNRNPQYKIRQKLSNCRLCTLQSLMVIPTIFKHFSSHLKKRYTKTKTKADVQKMGCPVGYLTGDAENCVKGLRLNNENYQKVLSMLKERFGQPQFLMSNHITKILELEAVWSVNDVKSLRQLYDCRHNYVF